MKQTALRPEDALPEDLIEYIPGFFSGDEAAGYIDALRSSIAWQQETFTIYGRTVDVPRLSAWYGDQGKTYRYSGKTYHPHPWTLELLNIRARIESIAKTSFNSVLLNWYRHGNDSMGWHADDESELGLNPIIASVSFGQPRRLDIRLKADHKVKHSMMLENGSLLLMKGDMQHRWQHQVPKSAKAAGDRINLTFRLIV